MARPMKQGMEYFPHDTDASSDEKIEGMRYLFGNDGYAFYFILLERIYRTPNGLLPVCGEQTRHILATKIGVAVTKFDEMLNASFSLGCFDKQEYESSGSLTSNGIKSRMRQVNAKRDKMREIRDARARNNDGTNQSHVTSLCTTNPPQTPERKEKKSKAISYTDEFEMFWQAYPRRDDKSRAFKTWRARMKEGATANEMITAAKNYAGWCKEIGRTVEFMKMPATFLGPDWREWVDKKSESQVAAEKEAARVAALTPEQREREQQLAGLVW